MLDMEDLEKRIAVAVLKEATPEGIKTLLEATVMIELIKLLRAENAKKEPNK